ncbi:GFA family protein [Tropicimonas sp. IMCC34043]|uniref:GFA family protein n=1 Tax=Tropicimonas sp. IMCC34043 TaxID=2248760 RepID=UPI0018E4F647|nr:GFA family protein [Tropicimonas sp. IMCC34043]
MEMDLTGSCHCKAVTFTLRSSQPFPFNLCYCEICRKTAGTGGYAINLGGDFATLEVEGKENIRTYRARQTDPDTGETVESPAERNFCGICGSALWVWDPRWPDLVHPHASAIDTPLPEPPHRSHMMQASRANWARPCLRDGDRTFDAYPDESLAEWHRRNVPD